LTSIIEKYPNAIFTIVGKHFPRSLRLNLHPTVRILESVSDIRSAYSEADALLAPIRIGGGTRYKIIEAMASGLPVITSTLGASGLPVKHAEEVYIADTALDVLHCIDNLLTDSKRKKLVERARKCIESSYSWESIARLQDACWRMYVKK
jgi:glycosyltransferase involved in cell wall biosynthesis